MLLCALSDLVENQGKGFQTKQGKIIVVLRENKVYGYLNMCPHLGINLEWEEDKYMDFENYFLMCSSHGALFQVEDGLCVGGPCIGESLKKIELKIENDQVWLQE